MTHANGNTYETTHFRTLGWIGAVLFTLAPPTFLYEWWLTFYTTAMEESPAIGPIMAIACVASFASVPMLVVGRRKRLSASPTTEALPLATMLPSLRRQGTLPAMPMDAS